MDVGSEYEQGSIVCLRIGWLSLIIGVLIKSHVTKGYFIGRKAYRDFLIIWVELGNYRLINKIIDFFKSSLKSVT